MELPEATQIVDASKLQTYMRCPRRYLFEHVLGWRSDAASIDLVFGSAWHEAMEVLITEGFTDEAIYQACEAFLAYYRRSFSEEYDVANAPKNAENAIRGIYQYAKLYGPEDRLLKVLYSEVAGSVLFGALPLYFKMDTVAECENRGILALERKTSTRYDARWANQFRKKMQISLYTYVLHCLYPGRQIHGLVIDGFFVHNAPRIKKDGTPYANEGDNEFHRIPIGRSPEAMNSWVVQLSILLEELERDLEELAEAEPTDPYLTCFRENTEACGDFRGCPFLDFCAIGKNPLRWNGPPSGMHLEWWDPRGEQDSLPTKNVVQLEALPVEAAE